MTTNLDFNYDDFSRDIEQSIENDINNIKTIDDFSNLIDKYTSSIDDSFTLWYEDDDIDLDESWIFKE